MNELVSKALFSEIPSQQWDLWSQKHESFPFAAVAELIDNAAEAMANNVHIDVDREVSDALRIWDDGIGIDRKTMNELFSPSGTPSGTQKETANGRTANYGVGFKSGACLLANDILVLSKTYECGCKVRTQVLAGKTSVCSCECPDKKPVRCLGFISRTWVAHKYFKGTWSNQNESIKESKLPVALIYWDAKGKGITKSNKERNALPGSEGKLGGITEEGIEEELKHVKLHSPLKTLKQINNYFEKISETGTIILCWPFPDDDRMATKLKVEMDKSGAAPDIRLEKQDGSSYKRKDCDRPNAVDYLPIDSSLRSYCEILFDVSVEGRHKMDIHIMGKKVRRPRCLSVVVFVQGVGVTL